MSSKKPKKYLRNKAKTKKPRRESDSAAKAKTSITKTPKIVPTDTLNEESPVFKKVFLALAVIILVFMLFLSVGSGVNTDDSYQCDYSEKLVDFYTTFGTNKEALNIERGQMHLYGGFFEIFAGFANRILGNGVEDPAYHSVRHLFNALMGFFAMLFTALIIQLLAGWRLAILGLIFMFLSPRFLGHSLMNPKDIPFALGYIMSLYFIFLLFRELPKPRWSTIAGLIAGIGISLGTRAGGLLVIAYFFLFAGVDFLLRYGIKELANWRKLLLYGKYLLGISLAGFGFSLLFWPYAMVSPIDHTIEALSTFSKIGVDIRVLYMGENNLASKNPWHYIPNWIFITSPLFVLTGAAMSVIFTKPLLKKYNPGIIFMLWFALIFPIAYLLFKDSRVYDGYRHLLFVYPCLVILAVLAWGQLESYFEKRNITYWAIAGVLGLMAIESTYFIVRNRHYPYVYFNALIGGINGAFGKYETDYWGISTKQAIQWMEKEGIIGPDMKEPVTIVTDNLFNVERYLGKKYGDKVKINYEKYIQRYNSDWDYAIYSSRFVKGPHLLNNTWPSKSSIHTINATGVPLATILKSGEKWAQKGQQAVISRNWNEAIEFFNKEVEIDPLNEVAWLGLGNAHLNLNNLQEARKNLEQCLQIDPSNLNATGLLGLYYLRVNDKAKAKEIFEYTVKMESRYPVGYYYLAIIAREQKNPDLAIQHLQNCVNADRNFKACYELAATIYEDKGDINNAQRMRSLMTQ